MGLTLFIFKIEANYNYYCIMTSTTHVANAYNEDIYA